jgi:hypothetical protein
VGHKSQKRKHVVAWEVQICNKLNTRFVEQNRTRRTYKTGKDNAIVEQVSIKEWKWAIRKTSKSHTSMVAADQILHENHLNDAHHDHQQAEYDVGDCVW